MTTLDNTDNNNLLSNHPNNRFNIYLFESAKQCFVFLLKKKTFKYTVFICSALVLLYLILCIVLSCINVNPYKENLEKQISEATGKIAVIEGPIQLRGFPTIALELHEVTLKNRPDSKYSFIRTKLLKCYPHLLHLLLGRIACKIELYQNQLPKFRIPQFITNIRYQGGIVELNESEINFGNNKQNKSIKIDHLKIDTQPKIPKFSLRHTSNQFQINPILEIFGSENRISGDMFLDVDLSGEGKTVEQLKKSLTGRCTVEISQGHIQGLNLIGSLKETKSLLETFSSKLSHSLGSLYNMLVHRKEHAKGTTPFDNIKLKLAIDRGIINTEYFKMRHAIYHVDAKGVINLSKNTIDCQLETLYKKKQESNKIDKILHYFSQNDPHLKIYITGHLNNPHITPDLKSYLHYLR